MSDRADALTWRAAGDHRPTTRSTRPARLGAPALAALTALAVVALLTALTTGLDLDVPWRAGLTIAFALSAPGAAIVCWAPLRDPALAVVACVVVGLAVVIVVAQAMVLARWWAPEAAMTTLAVLSAASLLARVGTARVGTARVGTARVGTARVGASRVGITRVGATAQPDRRSHDQ